MLPPFFGESTLLRITASHRNCRFGQAKDELAVSLGNDVE
jgi:hypothetical protein